MPIRFWRIGRWWVISTLDTIVAGRVALKLCGEGFITGIQYMKQFAPNWNSLQWRHNGHNSVSNHQPHDCLLNRLFRRRSKKHQSSASLAFVQGIQRWSVNSPHKWPVTRKCFHLMTSSWFSKLPVHGDMFLCLLHAEITCIYIILDDYRKFTCH